MTPQRFAIISNNAFSLLNFRGPLIGEIASRGHSVFALAPDFTDEIRSSLLKLGATPVDITISRTGLNPITDSFDLIRLARVIASLRLDVVLGFAIKPVIYGTMASRMAGVAKRYALIAGLGYAFGTGAVPSIKRRLVHTAAASLYKIALRQADAVFMQNPDDVEEFVLHGIVARDKTMLVNGTGVDLTEWPALPSVSRPLTFLLAARLLSEKGILDYVEAARMMKAHAPGTRFVLLGSLDSNPEAIGRSQVEDWVKEGIIEWPGHVDVRPWLAQTSVYVLPSYYREGIPRSIQEALASGRPVITADTPGCRETVIEGVNGFLVPPRNPQALAAAMERFVDNPGLVIDMGRESRLLAQSRFDVRRVNARMIEVMGL